MTQLVADGVITQDQADARLERMNNQDGTGKGMFGERKGAVRGFKNQ